MNKKYHLHEQLGCHNYRIKLNEDNEYTMVCDCGAVKISGNEIKEGGEIRSSKLAYNRFKEKYPKIVKLMEDLYEWSKHGTNGIINPTDPETKQADDYWNNGNIITTDKIIYPSKDNNVIWTTDTISTSPNTVPIGTISGVAGIHNDVYYDTETQSIKAYCKKMIEKDKTK